MADAGDEGVARTAGIWPAAVVHVNEDGWVLINRGGRQGVVPGMRLLVVGDQARELYDTAPAGASAAEAAEPAALLRIRRTYELLEVVYAEGQCAVAIAARVPRERRPQVYRAPGGELLVWVPLPPQYTWPTPTSSASDDTADTGEGDTTEVEQDLDGETDGIGEGEGEGEEQPQANDAVDMESLAEQQEDERWEQALPLNGIHVGDLVLPAISVSAASDATRSAASSADPTPGEHQVTPFDAGRDYDWLDKPPS